MHSSSCYFILRGLSISQIQKFMPKTWKQSVKHVDIQTSHPSPTSSDSRKCSLITHGIDNESMIDNLLISLKDFVSQGNLFRAFKIFSSIRLHASSTASDDIILHPISSLILCCANFKSLRQGEQLHAHVLSLGLDQHPILVPKLVTFYSTFNFLVSARSVTENSNIFHPLPWNLLISSYVRNAQYGEALSTYKQMKNKGIRPDNFTYPSVLKACGEMLDLDLGREVHRSIADSCVDWCLFVHNALISMYGKLGDVDVARSLFEIMPEKDNVSWNSMISNYASKGMWSEAFDLFEKMQDEGIVLNIITWNTIAGGCLKIGKYKEALKLLSQIRTCGTHVDAVAMIIGLGACSHIGAIKIGKEIHCLAIRSLCDGFDNVTNALITMYTRCRDLTHAYMLFRFMEARTIITWNSMLSGLAHMDLSEEASLLFREMLHSGFEPNFVTIASILPLCARVANLQYGKEFHCYITRREGFNNYLLIWNSLVEMYARSGKVLEARRLFDLMRNRDEVTYTSMIAGYGMQGEGRAALKLFEEMNRFQIKPDAVTMVAVLSACSHCGLVFEGEMVFKKMQSVYGIVPRLEHFDCMVDLYGRAGLLNKAKEIITRMPYRPSTALWATLLGACRIHGNTEVGEWAAEKLLEMRPENSGYYVLIANMYAAAGCWDKLAKVRTFMRDLGVKKAPGCAWVDVGTRFSHFLVGDTSNPQALEVYTVLEGLTELMKDTNYVSHTDFVSDDELVEEIG
ncbi:PPR domain-containing protein/PPR_2 domain-containing protein [Cephalotus follicularis]|uniref:PPR domain-containing protein/PPR_2 domain-containing protein n=1 Tax=Cephalotus follicularis TaxID=3775 RepID=A0A1Q3B957_CEPFO|nr:PPR domain-containing protein/PPR_2 domain-containing protein [Cephalotus follicularis]